MGLNGFLFNFAAQGWMLSMTAIGGFVGFDAIVTPSVGVDNQVAAWLVYGGGRPAIQAQLPLIQEESISVPAAIVQALPSGARRISTADDRLSIQSSVGDAELAQPVQISLSLTRSGVTSISVVQHDAERSFDNRRAGVTLGLGVAKVVSEDGLNKTIEITPLQAGPVDVDVMVIFNDGAIARQSLNLNVLPSAKGLKAFYLNHGSHVLSLVMEDKQEDRELWLSPEVSYEGLDYPIYLTDSNLLTFSVEQSESHPVIQVDKDGKVHALRPGKARITADFAGTKDTLTVTVYSKERAPLGYRRVPRHPVE